MCELSTELKACAKIRGDLVKDHEGQFVLMRGKRVIGIFEFEEDAVRKGYERFPYGKSAFLVKKITRPQRTLDLPDLPAALVDG